MSSTEFAMVEELAYLVKGNIYCKQLVLDTEDAFIDFLQDNTSSDGVLKLEPMNSYNRLLLHRLADIFGFSHHSVGEGEDRRLVVERCPGTSVPSILVRDLLWKYGELKFLRKYDNFDQESEDGSQVGDLALLIKDNLPCKHLVLSTEEAFVNFLQGDASSNGGVLQLEPMDSYSRHLLHRLADIFGLSHHSEGEGEDRHLIVERCPETSIPSTLVRDILLEYGEAQSTTNFDILPRKQEGADGSQVENPPNTLPFTSLEERETAYLAARQRIFSVDVNMTENSTQRPKKDLKVARRMIEHALGQRLRPSSNDVNCTDSEQSGHETIGGTDPSNQTCLDTDEGIKFSHSKSTDTELKMGMNDSVGSSGEEKRESKIEKDFKEQHMVAAKRMFANALGVPRDGNLSKRSESKQARASREDEIVTLDLFI